MTEQKTATRIHTRDLVLTVIAAAGGRSDLGRTSLQKAAFFTGVALGRDLGHSAYYYGPFSAAVEADTEALVASGLVEEDSRTIGVNRRGFPVTRYKYTVSPDGKDRVERLRDKYPSEVAQVDQLVARLLEVVGSLDQATLSAAAKTFYIAREQGTDVTPDDVAELARDYGWELSTSQVSKVASMLRELRFTGGRG